MNANPQHNEISGTNTWQPLAADSDLINSLPDEEWPSIESQEEYWRVRDRDLDRIESCCQWFDEIEKRELPFD